MISNNEIQSKTIDFLRFPLIIGVLFIHNQGTELVVRGVQIGSNQFLPLHYYCEHFFSNVVGSIAVPLFFFISGFLFFLNVTHFDTISYKNKLRARVKTLLIPYLLWNLATVIYYYVMRKTGIYTSEQPVINFRYIFECFVGKGVDNYFFGPISFQFWFIRDLMVACLLSPIIYFFCKKLKIYGVIILGLLWLSKCWFHYGGVSCMSNIFFFAVGALMGINKRNIIDDFAKIRNMSFLAYFVFALSDLLTKEYCFNEYFHRIGILFGIVSCFNLVALLFDKGRIKSSPFFSAASFFVFAIHEPFLLGNIAKLSFQILKPESDLLITALYFSNVVLTSVIALGLYWCLRRFSPKICKIITGGR